MNKLQRSRSVLEQRLSQPVEIDLDDNQLEKLERAETMLSFARVDFRKMYNTETKTIYLLVRFDREEEKVPEPKPEPELTSPTPKFDEEGWQRAFSEYCQSWEDELMNNPDVRSAYFGI